MHVKLAERRIAVENLERRVSVQMLLELGRRDVLNGVEPAVAREQAGFGERRDDDGHAAMKGALRRPESIVGRLAGV